MNLMQHVVKDLGRLSRGLFFEDLAPGIRWQSAGHTLLESDLQVYVNLTWFTEELFTNRNDIEENAIAGRPVPAAMVYAMAEGLIMPSLERTGLAFLHTDLDVKRATLLSALEDGQATPVRGCELAQTARW